MSTDCAGFDNHSYIFFNKPLVIPFQYKAQLALLGDALPTVSVLALTILEYNMLPLCKASAQMSRFSLPAAKTTELSSQFQANIPGI